MATTVVNVYAAEHDIYIGRPRGGRRPQDVPVGQYGFLGNPYSDGSREEVIEAFRAYFLDRVGNDPEFRAAVRSLAGKRLGCFCHPKPCHGDVIAAWVDEVST